MHVERALAFLNLVLYVPACVSLVLYACCLKKWYKRILVVSFCMWNALWYLEVYFSAFWTSSVIFCCIFRRVEYARLFCVVFFHVWNAIRYSVLYFTHVKLNLVFCVEFFCVRNALYYFVLYIFCVWNALWYFVLYFSACGRRSGILC